MFGFATERTAFSRLPVQWATRIAPRRATKVISSSTSATFAIESKKKPSARDCDKGKQQKWLTSRLGTNHTRTRERDQKSPSGGRGERSPTECSLNWVRCCFAEDSYSCQVGGRAVTLSAPFFRAPCLSRNESELPKATIPLVFTLSDMAHARRVGAKQLW